MAKKKLKDIAIELGIPFDDAYQIAVHNLSEEMITGKGKNTWISEEGQNILDNHSPMPIRYRGKVLSVAPNPNFVMVYIREIPMKVPVRVPFTLRGGKLVGKFIYLDAYIEDSIQYYQYAPPPSIYERQK
jgi:hypothetical protein